MVCHSAPISTLGDGSHWQKNKAFLPRLSMVIIQVLLSQRNCILLLTNCCYLSITVHFLIMHNSGGFWREKRINGIVYIKLA